MFILQLITMVPCGGMLNSTSQDLDFSQHTPLFAPSYRSRRYRPKGLSLSLNCGSLLPGLQLPPCSPPATPATKPHAWFAAWANINNTIMSIIPKFAFQVPSTAHLGKLYVSFILKPSVGTHTGQVYALCLCMGLHRCEALLHLPWEPLAYGAPAASSQFNVC
jgi:hypothetical protein